MFSFTTTIDVLLSTGSISHPPREALRVADYCIILCQSYVCLMMMAVTFVNNKQVASSRLPALAAAAQKTSTRTADTAYMHAMCASEELPDGFSDATCNVVKASRNFRKSAQLQRQTRTASLIIAATCDVRCGDTCVHGMRRGRWRGRKVRRAGVITACIKLDRELQYTVLGKQRSQSTPTCRSKTKGLFSKKRKPDSPVLPAKQNGRWGLAEQEQWVRQEPASIAQQQATPDSTNSRHEAALVQQQQQDWYSAALQQSAQLDNIAKQGESEHGDTLLPKDNRQRSRAMRRRAAAGQVTPQDEDWFSVALQQSAQLNHSGRVQAGA